MSVAVLMLGFEIDISNPFRELELVIPLIIAVIYFDRQPYIAAIVAVFGFGIAMLVGYLVHRQERIVTGFSELLLNPVADWRSIRDYWILLIVFSFTANILFSRILERFWAREIALARHPRRILRQVFMISISMDSTRFARRRLSVSGSPA